MIRCQNKKKNTSIFHIFVRKTKSVNTNFEIDILQERIKELSCLYDISSIANQSEKPFSEVIQETAERVVLAWRFPEDAVCVIKLDDEQWFSRALTEKTVVQKELIYIDSLIIGSIAVHYSAATRKATDFLKEEKELLKKLSFEISHIYERKIKKERDLVFQRIAQRQDRIAILEEITAGLAHELNTPLGNILGFAQLIMDGTSDKQTISDAEKIMNSALHTREIVKKLMYFSSELPQTLKETDINKLILETTHLLRPNLQAKDLSIEFQFPEKVILADVDSVQITQVLFNLILNAIYASHEKSSILIKLIDKGERFIIQVHDYGIGIDPSIQERIFDPFFSTKPIGQGTGLGLSVCHGIIKSYNGFILVASAKDEGTTFNIDLPKKQNV